MSAAVISMLFLRSMVMFASLSAILLKCLRWCVQDVTISRSASMRHCSYRPCRCRDLGIRRLRNCVRISWLSPSTFKP
ncbi:hypothetical protein PF010_g29715 [Phytophthora fragariae]|uniref:Secreted protein n=2 Tax=Phytophthora fragariae TaxID=53985 RepID=A0A6A3GXT3_9STRA|nr:hypothetical protein PF011_g29594 [Phytophthora fragariae]KAE9061711.1 hypothetical protein PF010_g29715 [Phytophthora fragariae]